MKCILVTGGAGYIGSHTAVELTNAGYDVVTADNLYNSEISAVEGVRKITGKEVAFEQVDCLDKNAMEKLFKKYQFSAVIHFAALKAVGESVEKPLDYYRNNLESLINVLSLMKENRVPNFVFSSSATVYGQPEELPATETTPRQKATSPYGNTKQICEDIIEDTVNATNGTMSALALRYFNPIGAHPSALIGELPKGIPNNLMPYITQTAAGIRKCLSIFGNDYDTPDGTAIRDYIDVTDLAKAHVAAMVRLIDKQNKTPYEVFNIGTGRPFSVLELVEIFEKTTGVKVNYRITGRRTGDIEKIWADTSLANRELGWKAEKSIEETLLSAWMWEKHLRGL